MTRLEIRLLGGFEVSLGNRPVPRFESQRVRALFAYLATQPGRAFSRDHLIGLLWPGQDEAIARHNLRQALYNLRNAIVPRDSSTASLVSDHHSVRFDPPPETWIDIHVFGEQLQIARTGESGRNLEALTHAAQVYRGDFLAGFFLNDSPAFEEWMLSEQDRLRESAISALRELVDVHIATGSYVLGIQHARKLLHIDPLAEDVHRKLMLLYSLSGRRSRALEHFEGLVRTLRDELGIEPMEETSALYRQILQDQLAPEVAVEKAETSGPVIPMVGRGSEMSALERDWRGVLSGEVRLTRVEGEAGIGKTRLVRAFLHQITSQTRATVLLGHSEDRQPSIPFQALAEAIGNAITTEVEVAERFLSGAPGPVLDDLAHVVPELRQLVPELGKRDGAAPIPRDRLVTAIALFFELITGRVRGSRAQPAILFLDNLQWADAASFDVLARLLPRLAGLPVWVILVYRDEDLPADHPVRTLSGGRHIDGCRLELSRLTPESIRSLTNTLVETEQATLLANWLAERSEGLPVAIAEWVNLLWDAGGLINRGDAWRLDWAASQLDELEPLSLPEVIQKRVSLLPSSTRRLLTLAAIAGHRFDFDILQAADDELASVVETGIEVMLQRWLVRQHQRYWADSRRERDIALFTRGARQGTFEFAHPFLRDALEATVSPLRKQFLHRRIAGALEAHWNGNLEAVIELLAHHSHEARLWQKALDHYEQAGTASAQVAHESARSYFKHALEALAELAREKPELTAELETRRRQLEERLAELGR